MVLDQVEAVAVKISSVSEQDPACQAETPRGIHCEPLELLEIPREVLERTIQEMSGGNAPSRASRRPARLRA
jgi:hypothetical protein